MARLDPLIPDLADTDASLTLLLAELERRGVRRIAASYLFLRPAFAGRLSEQLRLLLDRTVGIAGWVWRPLAEGVGGGAMIGPEECSRRFSRLGTLAAGYGIDVHVCTCKNPDWGAGSGCQIAGPSTHTLTPGLLPLFLGQDAHS